MKFVVTGCARSGTKYFAHLMLGAGIQCGHEDVFNSWGPDLETIPDWQERTDLDGDCSYNAAPFLAELQGNITTALLVRPPLDQIRPAVFTGEVDTDRPWVRFIDHYTGILEVEPGPKRAAAYWCQWNELADEHADFRFSPTSITTQLIDDLCSESGLAFDVEAARRALSSTSRQTNHRGSAEGIELADLGIYADRVVDLADRYQVPLSVAYLEN